MGEHNKNVLDNNTKENLSQPVAKNVSSTQVKEGVKGKKNIKEKKQKKEMIKIITKPIKNIYKKTKTKVAFEENKVKNYAEPTVSSTMRSNKEEQTDDADIMRYKLGETIYGAKEYVGKKNKYPFIKYLKNQSFGKAFESTTRKKHTMSIELKNIILTSHDKLSSYLDLAEQISRHLPVEYNGANAREKLYDLYITNNNTTLVDKNVEIYLLILNNIDSKFIRAKNFKITGNTGEIVPVFIKTYNNCDYTGRWQYRFKNLTCDPYISDIYNCDWVWLDIVFDTCLTGIINFPIGNTVMSLMCIPNKYGTARYVSIDEILINVPNNVKYVAYKHMIGKYDIDHVNKASWLDIVNIGNMPNIKLNSKCNNLEETLDYYKETQIPEMFADYHIFVDDSVLKEMSILRDRSYIYSLINLGKSVSKLLIYGLIIYLAQLEPILLIILKLSGVLDARDDNEFINIGKQVGDNAKSLYNLTNVDTKKLFEIHTLVNRTMTPVNWEKEYLHRVKPNLARVPPEFVYEQAKAIFLDGRLLRKDYKYKTRSWKRFWSERVEWGTTGAFYSEFKQDVDVISKLDKDFRNKFYYFIHMSNDISLDHYLNRKPATNSNVSIKYEWSKQRAIYGTDVTNYVMTQFVMQNCEDLLTRDLAIGKNSNIVRVREKIDYILDHKVPFCLDFEDFNSQHSITNMQMVILAFIHVWIDRFSLEQRKAATWLITSINEQIVNDKIGLNRKYRTRGTLLSGWRLTSFINTILNKVYFKFLQGSLDYKHNSIHSGDDIMVGIKSLREVQVIYRRCRDFNIRLSPLKCFVGSVAEFLRVDHKNTETGQYLSRGIATLVAGKIESKPAFNIRDVYEAIYDRYNSALKRNGDPIVLTQLKDEQIKSQSKKFGVSDFVQYLILNNNRILGGITNEPRLLPYSIDFYISQQQLEEAGVHKKITPGVYGYVERCLEVLPHQEKLLPIVAQYVQDKLDNAFIKLPNKIIVNKLTSEQLLRERMLLGHRGSFRNIMESIPEYGKLRIVGQTLEMFKTIRRSENLGYLLAASKDPIRFLNVVTTG